MRTIRLQAIVLAAAFAGAAALTMIPPAASAVDGEPFFISVTQKGDDMTLSWPRASNGAKYKLSREAEGKDFDNPSSTTKRNIKRLSASGETFYLQALDKSDDVVEQVYLSIAQAVDAAPSTIYQVSQTAGLRLTWNAPGYNAIVHDGDSEVATNDGGYNKASYSDTGADISVDLSAPDATPATIGFSLAPQLLKPQGPTNRGYFQTGDRVWSMIRWSTFIPNQYIKVPPNGGTCTGTYHGGDNRSFGFEGSSRTRVEIKATWLDANANYYTGISLRSATGVSRAYDSNYNLIRTDQVSPNGAYLKDFTQSYDGKYITGHVQHSIGNPLCPSYGPTIDWNATFTLYRNGSYYLGGEHDQAPSHEAYIMQAYHPSQYLSKPIYQFAFGGNFDYLFAPAPNKNFNQSGSGPFTTGTPGA